MSSIETVVAFGNNYEIGKDNDLLWPIGRMQRDMKHFRELTVGNTVVMGRRTYESLGRPLPERNNIVVSTKKELRGDGIEVAPSPEAALQRARMYSGVIYIIGGAALYQWAIHLPDLLKIHATHVDAHFPDADTFFPQIDERQWRVLTQDSFLKDETTIYPGKIVTYGRRG